MTLMKKSNLFFPGVSTFFDDFFTRDIASWQDGSWISNRFSPAVNIQEKAHEFAVELMAPGLQKEDFNIALENDRLSISFEKKMENEETSEGSYTYKEFAHQSFHRSFALPKDKVDADGITASYTDGILVVSIPKKQETPKIPAKTIQIS